MSAADWVSAILAAPSALIVLAAATLALGRGSKGGVYVWRTRKPGALLGWPIIGRHFAYVGQTTKFAFRERQHLGKPKPYDPYASYGAPWSDLSPRCYRIPLPCWRPLLLLVEWMLSAVLLPVYNARPKIPWNPRTITPHKAMKMRALRNRPTPMKPLRQAVGAIRWYHVAVAGLAMAVAVGMVTR